MAIPFLTNVDLNKNQALNLLLQQIAGNHGSPVEGIIWYDSTGKVIKYYDGTTVITLGAAGVGGDASTLDGLDSVYFLARSNHTGTQLAATISDFSSAVAALSLDADLLDGQNAAYYRARANHTGTQLAATISDFASAVLGVSGIATDTEVTTQINALIDAAPGTLDTLNELAAALGDDPNFATTVTDAINLKPDKASGDIGNGSATQIDFTHNLGTRDVVVSVRQSATPWAQVYPDVEMLDTNNVRLRFAVAPAASAYRVTVVG